MRKKSFTIIEIMFVVVILVILIGIGFAAGAKVLRKTASAKTAAELKMLQSAIIQYADRWGSDIGLPHSNGYNGPLNFCEHLSKVSVYDKWTMTKPDGTVVDSQRPMFIDFKKHNMNISNKDYMWCKPSGKNPSPSLAQDPYEQNYIYRNFGGKFEIRSAGLDGTIDTEDDIVTQGASKWD